MHTRYNLQVWHCQKGIRGKRKQPPKLGVSPEDIYSIPRIGGMVIQCQIIEDYESAQDRADATYSPFKHKTSTNQFTHNSDENVFLLTYLLTLRLFVACF